MRANSSAASTVTPTTKIALTRSLPRIKKGSSPLHDLGYANGNSGSHKGIPGMKSSSLPVALSAAASHHEAKILPNVDTSWTLPTGPREGEEKGQQEQLHHHHHHHHQNQIQRRLHSLHDFEELYKVRRKLGCGSYSVVFEVFDCVTGEQKAAKFVLRKEVRQGSKRKKRSGSGADHEKEKDGAMTAEGEHHGTSSHSSDVGSGPSPALSEALIKEIAVSLTVQHLNLVSTSDVFVHDVEGLRCRLEAYVPHLRVTLPTALKRNSNPDTACVVPQRAPTPQKSFGRTAFRGTCNGDGGSSSSTSEQCHSVLPTASPSQVVVDVGADSSRSAVDQVRRQLQEGQVQCILVMDLVNGCDLFTLVSRSPLSERRAAAYMLDLLMALQYLHARCIVHRDVKVENMVLDRDDNAHLIDYGFCEMLNRRSRSDARNDGTAIEMGDELLTQFCGSHHYVAPEVIRSAIQLHKPPRPCGVRGPGNSVFVKLPPIPLAERKTLCSATPTPTGAANDCDSESRVMRSAESSRSLQALLSSRQVGYGTSADMWSAGVVMFVMLHSAFPYHDDRRSKLLKMIMTGHQQKRPSPLLSGDARDLLQLLLTHDIRRRPTAAQALEHSWFKKQLSN